MNKHSRNIFDQSQIVPLTNHCEITVEISLGFVVFFCAFQLRAQLAAQFNAIQSDFEGLNIRLEEETEGSQNLRSQLLRVQSDYQATRSKYEKEVIVLTEELDDLRLVQEF